MTALSGWKQLVVALAIAGGLVVIIRLAGVPGAWAPLVIGGALGLMTALVAGAPERDEN
jgi:hypothetical protein